MTDTLVRFPRESDSPAEALACIRAIVDASIQHRPRNPDETIRAIGDMFHLYRLLVKASGSEHEIVAAELAEEEAGRQAIGDFVARHNRTTQEVDLTDPPIVVVDRATPAEADAQRGRPASPSSVVTNLRVCHEPL